MLLNLTDLSSEPLQQQIIRQIRAKILTGELPSIRALARENRVSVITVQRAYEELVRGELIHSRRGKGFFVSELPRTRKEDIARQRIAEQLAPIIHQAIADGLAPETITGIVRTILETTTTFHLEE